MKKRAECIGLPGTGKTVWSDTITTSLNKTGKAVTIHESFQNGLDKIIKKEKSLFRYKAAVLINRLRKKDLIPSLRTYNESISRFAVTHPELMENVWKSLEKVAEDRKSVILKLFLRDALMWEVSHKDSTDEIVLMDEGFVQRAAALFMHTEENKQSGFLKELEYPDILFYFRVPIETAEQRMLQRKQGIPPGFRHMSGGQRRIYFEQMQVRLGTLAEECRRNGTKIIYIDNNGGKQQTKKQIAQKIKGMHS